MLRRMLFGFLFLFALAGSASAQSCGPLPNTLTNGQPADASQVMANLNTLLNCVNAGRPAGGTNNNDTQFTQRIESFIAAPLAGNTVTVQFQRVGRVGAEGVTRHLDDEKRRITIRPTSCRIIAPRRSNSAHLHRPGRVTSEYAIGAKIGRFFD